MLHKAPKWITFLLACSTAGLAPAQTFYEGFLRCAMVRGLLVGAAKPECVPPQPEPS